MERYKNVSGDSGVVAYTITKTGIMVQFQDGGTYYYSYKRPGAHAVEAMKQRAVEGLGLATYINTHVREAYERKLT